MTSRMEIDPPAESDTASVDSATCVSRSRDPSTGFMARYSVKPGDQNPFITQIVALLSSFSQNMDEAREANIFHYNTLTNEGRKQAELLQALKGRLDKGESLVEGEVKRMRKAISHLTTEREMLNNLRQNLAQQEARQTQHEHVTVQIGQSLGEVENSSWARDRQLEQALKETKAMLEENEQKTKISKEQQSLLAEQVRILQKQLSELSAQLTTQAADQGKKGAEHEEEREDAAEG